jgi:hypothetical protein
MRCRYMAITTATGVPGNRDGGHHARYGRREGEMMEGEWLVVSINSRPSQQMVGD